MSLTSVKIKSIRKLSPEVVYDIQTEQHNFIANGHFVHNCLIFQESVMDLAEVVGGFPKDQCDNVRRAIMKRDLSKGESAIKEAQRMEDDFVAGATKNGVSESAARQAYQNILWFAGYGFNRAHAVAYAIDSYMCAWLLAKHEEEWLCAYLESMSNNPDDKTKAFAEIKSMGYRFVPIDINHASNTWTILQGKQFMPSFLSCKGVGESAVEEIVANRPYQGIDDLLWNDDGTWKHSKFNKKALDSLIKAGAFGSLNIVGPGKLFSTYRQMHYVLVENMDLVKKTSKRDPNVGRNNFHRLIEESKDLPDWTYGEKAANQVECFGSIDVGSLMDPVIADKLQEKGVKSIDQIESEKDIFWFVVESTTLKKTKNGKTYLSIEAKGTSGATFRIFCWGWPADKTLKQFTVCVAEVEPGNFGLSTNAWKLKELSVQ